MLLRSKGYIYPAYINASKRLLSNDIREVLNTRLEPLTGNSGYQLQLAEVSKNLNAVNLDIYVNNVSNYEDRRSAILDLLANLRASKLANTCLDSTHFGVVRHLLENASIQEVLPVLVDRPKYGIFLNDFTGFAVAQSLYEEKEYILGLPLVLKMVLLDELQSVFVQAFCLKSSLESLKKDLLKENSEEETSTANPPKGKVQEIKIRVKFLRNANDSNIHLEIAKAFLKISSKVLNGNAKDNAQVLAQVLAENYKYLDKSLSSKSVEISSDVAEICQKLLSKANQLEFVEKIDKLRVKSSFGEFLDRFLEETASKEAVTLAEEQKQLMVSWQQLRKEKKLALESEIAGRERIENIENIQNEIASKKELLWFFDREDELDLEIHNKRVFYPKRWFGKKKKPRVVDEHYVPPQIRKIH